jgi:hypothetical protein
MFRKLANKTSFKSILVRVLIRFSGAFGALDPVRRPVFAANREA